MQKQIAMLVAERDALKGEADAPQRKGSRKSA
jgi:hypothetical protein